VSSAVHQGAQAPFVAEFRLGTKVLIQWALWHKQHACPKASRIGLFRKEDMCLVVYQYGKALCVAFKKADVVPNIRNFREWQQRFTAVKGKLIQRGWALVEDREEVSHVAH